MDEAREALAEKSVDGAILEMEHARFAVIGSYAEPRLLHGPLIPGLSNHARVRNALNRAEAALERGDVALEAARVFLSVPRIT